MKKFLEKYLIMFLTSASKDGIKFFMKKEINCISMIMEIKDFIKF